MILNDDIIIYDHIIDFSKYVRSVSRILLKQFWGSSSLGYMGMCGFLKLRIQKTLDIYYDQRIKIPKICVCMCIYMCRSIVCTHPCLQRGLSLQPNFQKWRGLDRTSTFRGGLLGKGGGDFFHRGWQFSHKK